MKKKVIISIIFVIFGFSVSVKAQGTYSGGSGEPNNPYLIATAEDMNEIGAHPNDWHAHFLLVNDINLAEYTGTQFNIIGNESNPFTGIFDGNDHTISNFNWNLATADYVGLFGYVDDPNAEIKDLTLIDPNVQGCSNVGALVGCLGDGTITGCGVEGGAVSAVGTAGGVVGLNYFYGTISNCYATGAVSGNCFVGGLVGLNYSGISNCYATGSVTGNSFVGGLVGQTLGGTVRCYATGSVTGNYYVGGLVGETFLSGISYCYATGTVTGGSCVGGLVGFTTFGVTVGCYATGSVTGNYPVGGLVGHNGCLIKNCYAAGSVSGNDDYVGGLVGYNRSGMFFPSFWDTQTTGQASGIGYNQNTGGTFEVYGRTTAQMQNQTTFTDYGWDFVGETANGTEDIWKIDVNDYPRLWWQLSAPVLLEEPQFTLSTTNTIYWEPVPEANDYYAECANDPNFEKIIASSGWITDTNYEFNDLQLGQTYFYRVKARIFIFESGSSNIESSTQSTLFDVVNTLLDADNFKDPNQKDSFLEKIAVFEAMIEQGHYHPALKKLYNDILKRTDSCENQGAPDKNDWLITCEAQNQIYPLIMETIDYVMYQMGP